MRLISSFHDYYDGVGRGDLERTPIYERTDLSVQIRRAPSPAERFGRGPKDVPSADWTAWEPWASWLLEAPWLPGSIGRILQQDMYLPQRKSMIRFYRETPAVIFFTGQAHVGWVLLQGTYLEARPCWASFPDILPKLIDAVGSAQQRALKAVVHAEEARGSLITHTWTERNYQAWLSSQPRTDLSELHRRFRAPVLCLQKDGPFYVQARVNPRLTDYGFQSVIPPAQAWQAIDQYLGNEMAQQVDPAPLSDDLRRDAHGFDVWSFKNPDPPKRKTRPKPLSTLSGKGE